MRLVAGVLALIVQVFVLILLVRLVLEWVQVFAREWRPRGFMAVVAEIVYTITDPPLRALRSIIPPLTIGSIRLDLAFIALFLICWILLVVLALV